jgi:hypothetical protein
MTMERMHDFEEPPEPRRQADCGGDLDALRRRSRQQSRAARDLIARVAGQEDATRALEGLRNESGQ